MPVSNIQVRQVVNEYVSRFPGEKSRLASLVSLIDSGATVASRKTVPGHVTCGAVVIGPDGKLLVVHHRNLGKWLFPGGHLEDRDSTLRDAALRELKEETGITIKSLHLFGNWLDEMPVHIDSHGIPSHLEKKEPGHIHFDFRFLFRSASIVPKIQQAELSAAQWVPASSVPAAIAHRLEALHLINRT